MATDVARSLSLQPPSATATLRPKPAGATPEPHYRLSRLNPPQPAASLRPPSIISRSVSAGMTFSFKKEKDKDREKDKDMKHPPRAISPDSRPSSRFGLTLRKKVSLASLMSSSVSPVGADDSASSSRASSISSGGHVPIIVHPIEELPVAGPSVVREDYDSDDSDADEDVHAPERFVKKNAWRTRHRMKLHPYPDVPYMQAYDPVVLENERHTHYLLRRLAPIGSPTFHHYNNIPPASVLDLGCGAGLWLFDAARTWRSTQFPSPPSPTVPPPTSASSVATSSNTPSPFPDRQFELVRMANLSLCIPLSKWEYVLREVARVLAPGGRLELVDDQTFFPYGDAPVEEATEIEADRDAEADADLLSPTPTAHPTDAHSPRTPTPRAPPPTPDSSGFFDSSDEEDEASDDADASLDSEDAPHTEPNSSSDSDEPPQPTTPDSASERSSFADAASTLVGSERGSLEFKKLSLSSSGPPQLDFEPIHVGRPFSGVEHLVISIPPPEPLPVVDLTVDSESETESEMPLTPVPTRALPPLPTEAKPSLTPTSASSTSTTFPASLTPASASASDRTPTSVPTSNSAPPTPNADLTFDPAAPPAPELSSGPWTSKRAASKDIERVFERMLAVRYGLHTRPADVLVPILARVFCSSTGTGSRSAAGRVERPASMHLKLAPVGAEEREEKEREGSVREKDGKSVRPWMSTVEPEREGTLGRKGRIPKLQEPRESPIPQGISSKAAERLGIAVGGAVATQTIRARPPTTVFETPEGSEEEETDEFSSEDEQESPVSTSGSSADGSSTRLPLGRGASTWVAPDEWAAPPPSLSRENSSGDGFQTLSHASSSRTITAASSTKTIKQLGLGMQPPPPPSPTKLPTPSLMTHTRGSSTASMASTASALSAASRSTSSSASSGAYSDSDPGPARFSHGQMQHPGLVLWPATFIPLDAQELEMHATKHVQTLLGCKPALAGTGERVVSEAEFEDAVWEYECFRRPRFHWPELPENRLEASDVPSDVPTPASARSMRHETGAPRTPTSDVAPKSPIALEKPHPFGQHELTHVRTFRVFGAVKGGVHLIQPASPVGLPVH
ncbi:Methyltransf-25 domain-containing protein [Mycena venus]|uniref:Methyltransf-25 domain-containing protein n=1 Tax=Mycena venus TaxID=2733690 RepID=A0A8H6XW00_9AGAR|nr:Methyltransf-25 domain-containing protein [Mycena venus]